MSHFGGLRSQVFRKIQFSPENKFIFTGLVERSCHLDETARAEERQLENIIFLFEQAARRTNSLAHQDSVSIWKQGWRQVSTVSSGGNKPMCVFYQTCVEITQHLSVSVFHACLVISTRMCNKTHLCGESHTAGPCVVCGFYHTHVGKTKHVLK